MSELQKCPFCPDGIGILKDRYIQGIANRKTYWVECNKCQARIQNRRSAKRAVEAWNADYRRAQPENEPLTLSELYDIDSEPLYFHCMVGHWSLNGWHIVKAINYDGLQKRYTTTHNGKHCELVKTAIAALLVERGIPCL